MEIWRSVLESGDSIKRDLQESMWVVIRVRQLQSPICVCPLDTAVSREGKRRATS